MEKMAIGVMLGVGDDPEESLRKVREVGVNNAQMGCPPDEYLSGEKFEQLKKAIDAGGITITAVFCGFPGESYADIPTVQQTVGLVPPTTRSERLQKSKEIADFADRLGVKEVCAHIGFVPEDSSEPVYREVVEAVREVCDHCAANGQMFGLETGQESAAALKRFIEDVGRPNLKVNFDPANMILYGSGEPIAALDVLRDYVVSCHCKDGKWPTAPGQLGTEAPLGQGDVGMDKFIAKLKEIGYTGYLTIEREISGDQQKQDIIAARQLLEKLRG
ncbi:MAG: sugar phosphate isomerase/epimerase [Armatimonadetes bacterium]|nr:sugar phosphate isomerase/epimerase [Armatimonadota bacterium]